MVDHFQYLQEARSLCLKILKRRIIEISLNILLSQLKLTLDSGITIYIKYNEFEEYGYQIIFSREKYDFSRFDNYDDHWDVVSRPHHFHARNNAGVKSSPMLGIPKQDIPFLVKYLDGELDI